MSTHAAQRSAPPVRSLATRIFIGTLAIFTLSACASTATTAQSVPTSEASTAFSDTATPTDQLATSAGATAVSAGPTATSANETATSASHTAATTSIARAAAATFDASTARVPAYCDMPAQTLHDGKTLSKYLPKVGGIDESEATPLTVHLADLGSGTLAQYTCSAGGNGAPWPADVLLYNSSGTLVASLALSRYTSAEHAAVVSWKEAGGMVAVTWQSYEGAGVQPTLHHSTLTYSGGDLALT